MRDFLIVQDKPLMQYLLTLSYEPNRIADNRIADNRIVGNQIIDNLIFDDQEKVQIIEIEDGVKSLSCNPAESIATPQETDFDDEQLRTMLASLLYVQERGAKCRTITSLSLWTRKLDVEFLSRSDSYRETCSGAFKPT